MWCGMASFPGSNVHRVPRRKLGRGQHSIPPMVAIVAVVSHSSHTITIQFASNVVVTGIPPLVIGANKDEGTSFVVDYPNQITITFAAEVAGLAYEWLAPYQTVVGANGGQVVPVSGVMP